MSVISVYGRPYDNLEGNDYFSEGPIIAMSHYETNKDGRPAWEGRGIEKNADKLIRPFESPLASGHFVFSHGHLLENAGHFEEENNFSWEENIMSYMYWKKGYTIYAPNEIIIWHNYNSSYRPQFDTDKEKILQWNPHLRSADGKYF